MIEQSIVFLTLFVAFILFIWGKWRYDIVALLALLAVTITGIVEPGQAFLGFGHPAVVTVAAVLVASKGLESAGLVDTIAGKMSAFNEQPIVQMGLLTALVAFVSAFMNNIGALAILMPVAIHMARSNDQSPSKLLMPIAAGSLLGGMMTLIGTPPNIIIAKFRADEVGESFSMFHFAPVGLGLTIAGVLFITFIGWRLIPKREHRDTQEDMFEIEDYTTEVRISKESELAGKSLGELGDITDADIIVIGVVRNEHKRLAPSNMTVLNENDILIVEASSDDLQEFISATEVKLVGEKIFDAQQLDSEDIKLVEAVISSNSTLPGRTVKELDLRKRYGVNLLAVSREGKRVTERLRDIRFQAGDVLLVQGSVDALQQTFSITGCLPLAHRNIKLGRPKQVILSLGIFGIALVLTSLGFLAVEVAFTGAAVGMVITKLLTLREAYESVDWPIIILLGAMIPLGNALEETGGAQLVANGLLALAYDLPVYATLSLFMLVTMALSNVINNAAAAVLMAPIAISLANGIDASVDPFLMSVAIAASTAFLTPIGHQSNTLVMGPGGYKFGDYWQMGLPLSFIIILLGVPLILFFWPA